MSAVLDRPTERVPARPDGPPAPRADELHAPRPGARVAAIVALLALALAASTLPSGPSVSGGRFAELIAGPLEVRSAGSWQALPVGAMVADGATVRAVGDVVTLDLDGGRLLLDAGTLASTEDGTLVVERGSVLIEHVEARTAAVDGVRVTGRGAWRVDAGASGRVATYEGSLEVDDGSRRVELRPYRQVRLRDRALQGVPAVPLRYLRADAFDRRHLTDALRVDELTEALGRSLAGTYGSAPRAEAFYTAFVTAGDAAASLTALAPLRSGEEFGPPAEVLLGVVVSDAVASVSETTVAEAARQVAALRDRGATWGLVLQAAGGGADDLQAAADRALVQVAEDPPPVDETPLTVVEVGADAPAPAPGGGASPGDVSGGAGPAPGTGTPSPDRGTDGSGATETPPASPPSPSPTPTSPPPPAPSGPVEDVVRDPGGTLGEVVEGVTGAVDGVLGGVDELLGPPLRGLLGGG